MWRYNEGSDRIMACCLSLGNDMGLLTGYKLSLDHNSATFWSIAMEKRMRISSPSAGNNRIRFKNPPLNELVIALYHLPIEELRAQHIGLYWDRIRKGYPNCEQQPPVVTHLDSPEVSALLLEPIRAREVLPLPRFWFFGDLHPTLIQVQRNAFMYNWRRRESTDEYPHYETLVEGFWKELDRYRVFISEIVGGKLDVVQRCELSYVNIIGSNEFFARPSQLGEILPLFDSLHSLETDDRTFTGLNATITYRVNPTLFIDLSPRVGIRAGTDQPVVSLELKAHGAPSDLSLEGSQAWYDIAHDAIYQMFLDSSNKQMQEKIWQPQ